MGRKPRCAKFLTQFFRAVLSGLSFRLRFHHLDVLYAGLGHESIGKVKRRGAFHDYLARGTARKPHAIQEAF